MPAIPLDGFPPAFFPRCPKCDSGSLHFQRTKHPFMWGKTDLQFSCFTCGLVKYGELAVRQAFEGALAKWNRQGQEEAAFQVSLDKERAERVAQEIVASRLRREQEALERAEVEAQKVKEVARLARERKKARAQERATLEAQATLDREREQAEAEIAATHKEQAEEQARVEQARVEAEHQVRGRAREQAARWAKIEAMRKRDAERQANLQRELKRERDTRYREKKRGKLAASPVAVLPVPAPPLASVPSPVPSLAPVQVAGETSETKNCAWHGCANEKRVNSIYCSRTCNNYNAHARAVARAKLATTKAKKAKDAKKASKAKGQLRKEVLARKARYETRTTTESV